MGFWERDVRDSLDKLFDFNGDGKLDIIEESIEMDALSGGRLFGEKGDDAGDLFDDDDDDYDDDDDDDDDLSDDDESDGFRGRFRIRYGDDEAEDDEDDGDYSGFSGHFSIHYGDDAEDE